MKLVHSVHFENNPIELVHNGRDYFLGDPGNREVCYTLNDVHEMFQKGLHGSAKDQKGWGMKTSINEEVRGSDPPTIMKMSSSTAEMQ